MNIIAGISKERSHSDDNNNYLIAPYTEDMLASGKIEQAESNSIENRFLVLYNPETKKFTLPVLDSPKKFINLLIRYIDVINRAEQAMSFDWPDLTPLNKLIANPKNYMITLVD